MPSLLGTVTPNTNANVTLNKASTFGTHAGPPRRPRLHLVLGTPPLLSAARTGIVRLCARDIPGKSEFNGDTAVRQAEAGSAAEGPSHASYLPYCLVADLHILHTSRQS